MDKNVHFYYNKETKEIQIYYGEEREDNKIDLGILEAGKEIEKVVTVYNTLAYPVNISFEIKGEKIKLKDKFDNIPPFQKRNLVLLINTTLTELKAPTVSLKLKINLVV